MTVKRFLCVLLVVLLLVVPVSAEYDSYYELSPVVSSPELFSSGVSLAAVADSGISTMNLTTNESQWLHDIRDAFYYNVSSSNGSIIYNIDRIVDNVYSIYSEVQNLDNVTVPYANNKLDQIYSALTNTTDGLKPVASIMASRLNSIDSTNSTIAAVLQSINASFTFPVNTPSNFGSSAFDTILGPASFPYWVNQMGVQLGFDVELKDTNDRTLYSRIKQLQETLASDDDKALAKSQKDNREVIEDSFLSGASGGTSLGTSDFGALSDIGDTVKETISLNGQSSVSDFTDGLAGADEAGQGWFSESTRSALDTVSSSASYGLRDDPYNMSGWQDRYAWLEGEE